MSVATHGETAGEDPATDLVAAGSDVPAASVVVPTHARPERLARLLDSLARQTLPDHRFEIVIVDDGSPSPVRLDAAAGDAGVRPDVRPDVRVVRQARSGPAAARNRGAREARAPLLLFVDDDCAAAPDWVAAHVAAHAGCPDALLGGVTTNGLPDNPWSDAAEGLLDFLDAEATAGGGALDFVASNNIACARARFLEIGGFDARYPLAAGEDRAFCRAWVASGAPIVRVPEARVAHFHALDPARFWRQQHNYGRGAARFHADAPHDRAAARGVPALPRPAGFYARLLLHPLRRTELSLPRRLGALPRVALSQAAIVAGLAAERRAMRRESRAREGVARDG